MSAILFLALMLPNGQLAITNTAFRNMAACTIAEAHIRSSIQSTMQYPVNIVLSTCEKYD